MILYHELFGYIKGENTVLQDDFKPCAAFFYCASTFCYFSLSTIPVDATHRPGVTKQALLPLHTTVYARLRFDREKPSSAISPLVDSSRIMPVTTSPQRSYNRTTHRKISSWHSHSHDNILCFYASEYCCCSHGTVMYDQSLHRVCVMTNDHVDQSGLGCRRNSQFKATYQFV